MNLQDRFAVIMDIDQRDKGMKKSNLDTGLERAIHEDLLKSHRARRGVRPHERFVLHTYSELEGLPCILILVEKGKMGKSDQLSRARRLALTSKFGLTFIGDTFPHSLRLYDLSLRYARGLTSRSSAEQDMGRAFGYHKGTKPVVLVSQECFAALRHESDNGTALLQLAPDHKLRRCEEASGEWPESVFDSAVFRSDFLPTPAHFDYIERPEHDLTFLLWGLPQIGKTGACKSAHETPKSV